MLTKYRIEYTECDFKREVDRTKTKHWLKTICAYANGIGGMLVFGINDKTRTHVPLKDIQSDIEFITNCIKDRISPVPDFVLAPDTDEDGNEILVLKIKGGLNIGTNRTWDTLKSEYIAKDFSFTLLKSMYYNMVGTRMEDGDFYSFGLVTKDGFLTNAGVFFTDVCPLRHSRIFCTCWNGNTKAPSTFDALDDKEYSGNILQLLSAGEDFIKLHNQKIWYKLPTSRVEKENFPTRAVHEAMVNALVHRDYGVLGSEIHINIFNNRLEIQNPGGMYDGVPVQCQDIENVISTRRNPVIADIMSRMHFMERRGSGFRKILDAIKTAPNYTDNTLPTFHSTPFIFTIEFKNMNDGFKVDGTINVSEGIVEEGDRINVRINDTLNASEDIVEGDDRINDTLNVRINDTLNVSEDIVKGDDRINDTLNDTLNDTINDSNDRIKLLESEVYIYSEIQLNPLATIPSLMQKTGLSRPTITRALKVLKDYGFIVREGAKKKGYWQVNEIQNLKK